MTTVEEAAVILSAVAEFDTRFQNLNPQESHTRARAWAATLTPHKLTNPQVYEAIKSVYARPDRPANPIGAIIAEAKLIRAHAARGKVVAELQAGRGPAATGPVALAYERNGAIAHPCPTCGAQPQQWCINPRTGKPRRVPCIDRVTVLPPSSGDVQARAYAGGRAA